MIISTRIRSETLVLPLLNYIVYLVNTKVRVFRYSSNYSHVIWCLPMANFSSSRCLNNRNHSLKEVVRIFRIHVSQNLVEQGVEVWRLLFMECWMLWCKLSSVLKNSYVIFVILKSTKQYTCLLHIMGN